jgi:outer membrane protein assembly factor BamB
VPDPIPRNRNVGNAEVPPEVVPQPPGVLFEPPAQPPGVAAPPPVRPLGFRPPARGTRVGLIALVAVLLVAGFIVWNATRNNQSAAGSGQGAAAAPGQASAAAGQAGWTAAKVLQEQAVAGDGEARAVDASVAGGHLYYTLNLAHNAGTVLVSLSAATGQQEWRYQPSGQTPFDATAPTLVGDVVIGHDDSTLFALDAKSGQVRWQKSIAGGSMPAPVIANDLVMLWDKSRDTVSVYRAATGAQVWTRNTLDVFNQVGHVSLSGDQLLVLRSNTLERWDIKSGQDRWRQTLETKGSEDDHGVAIGGAAAGLVVIARFQSVEARRLLDGSRVWRIEVPSPGYPQDLMVSSQAAIVTTCAAGYPCANGRPPVRTAYDPATGKQLWQEPTAGAEGSIEPTRVHVAWLDDNTLVQWQAYQPRVWLVDAHTGAVASDKSLTTIRPAAATGDAHFVYVVDLSGAVLATAR